MEELRQNPGENEGAAVTPTPDDALENVLDAWSSEPSSRQRYDRLRLERRDGESLVLLVDAETARDLGDKLTIVAARARARSRGPAGVPVDRAVDPGDAEDMARARKVFDLAGLEGHTTGLPILAEEFKASREDVKKAHAMLDEQRAKHVADMAAIAQRHVDAARELERARIDIAELSESRSDLAAERTALAVELAKLRGESSIDLSDPSEPAPP